MSRIPKRTKINDGPDCAALLLPIVAAAACLVRFEVSDPTKVDNIPLATCQVNVQDPHTGMSVWSFLERQ